jgi:hypothetical protein
MSVTPPERRGEVIGAVGLAQGLACIVGTSLGALIYASDVLSFPRLGIVNYNVPFWFSAILLTVGAVMAFTWIRRLHCHRDPGNGVTLRQRNIVVAASIIGLVCLLAWIGFRYARPVPPDRVAWAWVQQLVRGRPDKAAKFALNGAWVGPYETKYRDWKKKREARYTVHFADIADDRASVPVRFVLKGGIVHEEVVYVCRLGSGEWKVCGAKSDNTPEKQQAD